VGHPGGRKKLPHSTKRRLNGAPGEIRSFVGPKAKNVSADKKQDGWGDAWTWTAVDADSKLCVSYFVGGRDAGCAYEFMQDSLIESRAAYRSRQTDIGPFWKRPKALLGWTWITHNCRRYTALRPMPSSADIHQPKCIGADVKIVSGNPDSKHVSTPMLSGRT